MDNDGVPRVSWKPVGDWHEISANKKLLLFEPGFRSIKVGIIDLSESDPRGDLWDENMMRRLRFENYSHYSYLCPPMM